MIPWSFSRLTDFETCPYRFQLKYIEKLPEAPNPAAERGTEIHKQYENFALNKGPCPSEFFKPRLEHFLKYNPKWSIETEWAFDKEWKPCSWFDNATWVRIKPDLHIQHSIAGCTVVDYKTGKESIFKHTAQGQLYAVGSYLIKPTTTVTIEFWYHDLNKPTFTTYTDTQILKLKTQCTQRAQKLDTNHFPPKPTKSNCKYCGMAPQCGYKVE